MLPDSSLSKGQKLVENAKNGQFGECLKIWSLSSDSVTRQVTFNSRRNGEKSQNLKKSKCDILGDFQTLWELLLSFLKTQQSTLIWVSSDIEVDY